MNLPPESACALRIMMALTEHSSPTGATALAAQIKISVPMVQRTLQMLGRAQLVRRHGADYALGFHPAAIHVSDVLEVVMPSARTGGCPLATIGCTPNHPCALCWQFVEADLAAMEVLRRVTLDDLRKTPYGGGVAVA